MHDRPLEKIEKNYTGGVSEGEYLQCSEELGRDGGSPFPVEQAQRQEGVHLFFIFPFLLPSMKERFFLKARFHFGNFLITLLQPPVSSQDSLPLSPK